jgi:hypothetical protein
MDMAQDRRLAVFLGGAPTLTQLYFSSIPSIHPFLGTDPRSPFNIPFVITTAALFSKCTIR